MRRRDLLRLTAASCACSVCGLAGARVLDYRLVATEIGAGSWAVHGLTEQFDQRNGGNIVNTAFIEVPDGVVLVDTGPSRRYGEALLALIEKTVPGKPLVRVYNTHHHPDHFFGNQVFDPAIIAAPQTVIDNMKRDGNALADNLYRLLGDWMRGTTPTVPGQALTAARETAGGREFSLYYLSGHTSSDFVVRDDTTGILYTGDLAFLDRAPTTPDADLPAWHRAIRSLAATDRELILPGHGPSDTRGASLRQTADYLDWLDGVLRDAVGRGLTMNEAMQLPIPRRLAALGVVRAEFRRSVVHLYPRLQTALFEEVDVSR